MAEIIAACLTTIDIVVVYALLRIRKGKLVLALWTSFLNIMLPLIGFYAGEWSVHFFAEWSTLLSGILLALIGLHMILEDGGNTSSKQAHPFLIALAVSLDAFSISVSFGMLQMNKFLFIAASGLFSLVFAYIVLFFKSKLHIKNGKYIKILAGVCLLSMGIWSCFSQ